MTLTVGLLSLKSPDEPIGNPMFSILEILIIVMMPALVALMVAVHAWASIAVKSLTLISVIFMGLLASVTCSLHFVYLAFGCIRPGHPRMGCIFRGRHVLRRCSLSGESFVKLDLWSDGSERDTQCRRAERTNFRQHAAEEHWNRRLCRGFPGGSGLAVRVVLQDELREEIAVGYCPERGPAQAMTLETKAELQGFIALAKGDSPLRRPIRADLTRRGSLTLC